MEAVARRRVWAVASLVALVAMLVLNGLANTLPLNGVDTGQLSDEIPNLFVPAGLTFAIWGLIYALLLGYVAVVLRAGFARAGNPAWEPADGGLFTANALLNAAWILAWHWRLVPLSLLIMAGILVTLLVLMERNHGRTGATGGAVTRFFLRVPLLVYLGWICVATIANVTALLVKLGWDGFGLAETWWAVIVIGVGTVVGAFLASARGAVSAGLVVIWAYVGIVLKRTAVDPEPSAPIIAAAYIGIAVVAAAIAARLVAAGRGSARRGGSGVAGS